jgi:hypothetical protein
MESTRRRQEYSDYRRFLTAGRVVKYSYHVPPRILALFLKLDSYRWTDHVGAWFNISNDVVAWWECWRLPEGEA